MDSRFGKEKRGTSNRRAVAVRILLASLAAVALFSSNLAAQDFRLTTTTETAKIAPNRTLDSKFWLMTAATVGMTIADVEMTQRCIRNGTCHEGNPLLPETSRAKIYPIQFALIGVQSYFSYRLKKRGSQAWWLPQFSLAASHGVGLAFGLRFAWQ